MKVSHGPNSRYVTTMFAIERRLAQLRNEAQEHEPRPSQELTVEEAGAVRVFLRMHVLKQPDFALAEPAAARILNRLLTRLSTFDEPDPTPSERVSLETL